MNIRFCGIVITLVAAQVIVPTPAGDHIIRGEAIEQVISIAARKCHCAKISHGPYHPRYGFESNFVDAGHGTREQPAQRYARDCESGCRIENNQV